ncbi:MAG: right-handed parallel beta-helix repeat-containing protein [Candidatus Zipacnadales bacterium]
MNVGSELLALAACLGLWIESIESRIDDLLPPEDLGQTWVEIEGEIYGARPDALGPLGGGAGYTRLVTEGDYRVSDIDALREALKQAQPGQVVYVEEGSDIDCTTLVFTEKLVIEVPSGVTLASNRGQNGSRGAVIYSDAFQTNPLIRVGGPDVRITGLWIRGPDPKPRLDHHRRSFNPERGDREAQHEYYYRFPCSVGIRSDFDRLEVDNCELSGWSVAAVELHSGEGHHIHHCYIHHNQYDGLGYGVCLGSGKKSVALIEQNLFNYNRHSIAGPGVPGNGYEACHNVEIGEALSHNFDMHGGRDRRDGTDIAGDWMKIHHNTFRGTGVAAVVIRGVPQQQAEIDHNWFFHPEPGSKVIVPWPTGGESHVICRNNAYGPMNPTVADRE